MPSNDDRVFGLRPTRKSLNKNNRSGNPGIVQHWNGMWQARITFNYRTIYLGTFKDWQDALNEFFTARTAREHGDFKKYYASIIARNVVSPRKDNMATLAEQYENKSICWARQSDQLIRFTLDDGNQIALPFFGIVAARWMAEEEFLALEWPMCAVIVKGPKSIDFYNSFCEHHATCLKSDGTDIISVALLMAGSEDRKTPGTS